MKQPRVVSLIASATEMVHALGMGPALVGRSHECDFPEAVKVLPVCTSPKFLTDGTSYAIDQRIKAILQEGLSVYRVDANRLASLKPDVILTQTQCAVCAVSQRDVEEALCAWVSGRPRVVSLEPNGLADVWLDVQQVANALDVVEKGRDLVSSLQERVEAITRLASRTQSRPTVACIEWLDPLMASGNWMPELVERAGGRNLFGSAGRHAPFLDWRDLVAHDPDDILVLPCGFDVARTASEMTVLEARPGWRKLRAVRGERVYLLDGNQFFNRPGPRLVESLEILGEILHPTTFSFGWQGRGWIPWRPGVGGG